MGGWGIGASCGGVINIPEGRAGCWESIKSDLLFPPYLAYVQVSHRARLLIELWAGGPFERRTCLSVVRSVCLSETVNKPLTWLWQTAAGQPASGRYRLLCAATQYHKKSISLGRFLIGYHGNRSFQSYYLGIKFPLLLLHYTAGWRGGINQTNELHLRLNPGFSQTTFVPDLWLQTKYQFWNNPNLCPILGLLWHFNSPVITSRTTKATVPTRSVRKGVKFPLKDSKRVMVLRLECLQAIVKWLKDCWRTGRQLPPQPAVRQPSQMATSAVVAAVRASLLPINAPNGDDEPETVCSVSAAQPVHFKNTTKKRSKFCSF